MAYTNLDDSYRHTSLGRRILSAALAVTMGMSCMATSNYGLTKKSDIVKADYEQPISVQRESGNGDYELNNTYYDIGTLKGQAYWNAGNNSWNDSGSNDQLQIEGWNVYDVHSFLDPNGDGIDDSGNTVNSLPFTTDINVSNSYSSKELMCWQAYVSKERRSYLERTDLPDFTASTYNSTVPAYYIAKGTVSQDGDALKITWDVRSWTTESSTWIDPNAFSNTDLTDLGNPIVVENKNVTAMLDYFKSHGSELESLWNKGSFETESQKSQSLTMDSTIDTWWKAVAPKMYRTTVEYNGTKSTSSISRDTIWNTNISICKPEALGLATGINTNEKATIAFSAKMNINGNKYNGASTNSVLASNDDSFYSTGGLISHNVVLNYNTWFRILENTDLSNARQTATAPDNWGTEIPTSYTAAYFADDDNSHESQIDLVFSGSNFVTILANSAKCLSVDTNGTDKNVKFDSSKSDADSFKSNMDSYLKTNALTSNSDILTYSNGYYTLNSAIFDVSKSNEIWKALAVWMFNHYSVSDTQYTDIWHFDGSTATISDEMKKNLRDVVITATAPSTSDHNVKLSFKNLAFNDITTVTEGTNGSRHISNHPATNYMGSIIDAADSVTGHMNMHMSYGYQRAGGTISAKRTTSSSFTTNAVTSDLTTNGQNGIAKKDAKITDTLTYNGLNSETYYVVIGALYEKATGDAIMSDGTIASGVKDVICKDGITEELGGKQKYIISAKVFKPVASSGNDITLDFTYDASNFAGKSIVVCEKIYRVSENVPITTGVSTTHSKDISLDTAENRSDFADIFANKLSFIGAHADKNDANQTITIQSPSISTSAYFTGTTNRMISTTENVSITDTISYNNFAPGTYYVRTKLYHDGSAENVGEIKEVNINNVSDTFDVTFTLTAEKASALANGDLVVYEYVYNKNTDASSDLIDKAYAVHANANDANQTVRVELAPTIKTTAYAGGNDTARVKSLNCATSVAVVDEVECSNLIVGQKYYLKTFVCAKNAWSDVKTNDEFTATDKTQIVSTEFNYDTTNLKGEDIYIGQELYVVGDTTPVATHKDKIDSQKLSIETPSIATVAHAEGDPNNHNVDVAEAINIVDTVNCSYLTVNGQYKLSAKLFDCATDNRTTPIATAEKEFTATNATQSVDVIFENVNTSKLAGHRLVVYEYLTQDNTEIATHTEDVDDQIVTVKTPIIKSKASKWIDSTDVTIDGFESFNQVQTVEFGDKIRIMDVVVAENLPANEQFWILSDIMAETEKGVKSIVADKTPVLVQTNSDGKAIASFYSELNSTVTVEDINVFLKNKKVVFYATVYSHHSDNFEDDIIDANKVAEHTDFNNESQTVSITNPNPSIETIAHASETINLDTFEKGSDQIDADTNVTIYDTVKYKNLNVNDTYTLKAKVYVFDTNTEIPVISESGEVSFTTSSVNGNVVVPIKINALEQAGKKLVVTEELYDRNNVRIAYHTEKNAVSQSITVKKPEVSTVASSAQSAKNRIVALSTEAKIYDTVTCSNFAANTTYKLTTELFDDTANNTVNLINVTPTTFTTDAKGDATVNVTITANTTVLKAHKLVVFETVSKSDDTKIVVHNKPDDDDQTVIVDNPEPNIRTIAKDSTRTKDVIDCLDEVTISDEVLYSHLDLNTEYHLEADIYDVSDVNNPVKINTQPFVGQKFNTGASADGKQYVNIKFDALKYAGKKIVVTEKLYKTGETIPTAIHVQYDDNDQTVTVKTPELKTTAGSSDALSSKEIMVSDKAMIFDKVECTNLAANTEYILVTGLYDITDPIHKEYVSENVMTKNITSKADGTWSDTISFKYDTRSVEGKTLVIFETLYRAKGDDKVKIVEHTSDDDANQTITIQKPEIGTVATTNNATDDKLVDISATAKINDVVSYSGLAANTKYTLVTRLFNKTTDSLIADSEKTTVVTTTGTNGEFDPITITVNTVDIEGADLVVYETLYLGEGNNKVEIADHSNKDDKGQTVTVDKSTPSISTTATSKGTKVVDVLTDAEIVDKVAYRNLKTDTTYKLVASLYDASTEEKITIIGGTKEFTPSAKNGSVDVTFEFDATKYVGKKIFVAEDLYEVEGNKFVTRHYDKEDTDQTVTVKTPSISTVAKDKVSNSDKIDVGTSAVIVDKVTVSGLSVGTEYTLVTGVYDATQKAWVVEDSESTFTFTKDKDEISVDINVGIVGREGHDLVVTQVVRLGDVEIVKHTSLTNKDQTVTVRNPSISTKAFDASKSSQNIDCMKDAVIIDVVSCKDLVKGQEYTLVSGLWDATDSAWIDAPASVTFNAENEDTDVDVKITVDTSKFAGHTLVVVEKLNRGDATIVNHNSLNDKDQTVTVKTPEIGTKAMNADKTDKVIEVGKTAKVIDTVSYKGLAASTKYVLTAGLYDKTTNTYLDATETTFEFTTSNTGEGSVDVEITVNTTNLKAHSLVAYETLTLKSNIVVEHKNPDDKEQTVVVDNPLHPSIKTTATNSSKSDHKIDCYTGMVIIDAVDYEDLVEGEEYILTAGLYDVTAGKWVDEKITTKTFVASSDKGSVDVKITLDTTALAGHKLVVTEKLIHDDKELVKHDALDDADQTVEVRKPTIETVATNATGDSKIIASNTKAVIVDKVNYTNLAKENEYTLVAGVYDNTADEWVVEATKPQTFTPEMSNGSVDVRITVDTTERKGHSLVVFETLSVGNKVIVTHKDFDDDRQTVEVDSPATPSIGTIATAEDKESHELVCGDNVTIIDTVSYSNLNVSESYVLTAEVYDATVEGWLDVTGRKQFTAKAANGTEEVEIKLDTREIYGHTLVIKETLTSGNTVVAVHDDLEDKQQTVVVKSPTIVTKATDFSKKLQIIDCLPKTTVVDTVTYTNLDTKTEYVMTAGIYDSTAKEWISENVASVTFTPAFENGSVDVKFDVNTLGRQGHKLVIVETLLSDDKVIVEHKDLYDEEQTVTVRTPSIQTVARDVDGDKSIPCSESAIIVDEVSYTDFSSRGNYNGDYYLTVKLWDNTEGKWITEKAETKLDSSNAFTPNKNDNNGWSFGINNNDGKFILNVYLDTSDIKEHEIILAQDIYVADEEGNKYLIIEHFDKTGAQSVIVDSPVIQTKATGPDGVDKGIEVGKSAIIVDKVMYSKLSQNTEYTLVANVYDITENGQAVLIKDAETTKSFKTTEADGDVNVDIKLDTTLLLGHTLVVTEVLKHNDNNVAIHVDYADTDQTVTVKIPELRTIATDDAKVTHDISCGNNVKIIDTIDYTNLVAGQSYVISTRVFDKTAGELLDATETQNFVPDAANGSVEVSISVNTIDLVGHSLVVYETLLIDKIEIAKHENPDDEDQTVFVVVPTIDTVAVDKASGTHEGIVSTKSVIEDTVSYTGLAKGERYTLVTDIYNKATGKKINKDSIIQTLTPESANGSVVVSINVDTLALGDVDIVVYETIKDVNGKEVVLHADLDDADQTVSYKGATLDTVAYAADGTSKIIACARDTVILDKVSYTGLEEGQTYSVTTTVYDTSDNNKQIATANESVRVDNTNGTFDVSIKINTTELKGHKLVVSETVTLSGKTIVEHKDYADADQMVTVANPEIRTTATSKLTGTHSLELAKTAVIVDRVTYTGLTPGVKYVITATPYNKESNSAITSVTPVSVEFTPDKADGYIDVEVAIDTSALAGKSIVMFESLSSDSSIVATHEDINDEDQTVVVVSIKTTAGDPEGNKTLPNNKVAVVIDKVEYSGLVPGQKYILVGSVVDKNSPSTVVATNEIVFEPENADGTIGIKFEFDTNDKAGKSYVCFESVYLMDGESRGDLIAEHADVNDADQTVNIETSSITKTPTSPTTPTSSTPPSSTPRSSTPNSSTPSSSQPQTGDASNAPLHAAIALAFALGFVTFVTVKVVKRKRRRSK